MVGTWIGCHDLGDCERFDGFLCDECRIEYQSRWDEMDQQDEIDERVKYG